MKEEELMEKYELILKDLRKGKSLTSISKERKLCINNLRYQLKKRFPKDFSKYAHGEVIGYHEGYELRKMPNGHTNSCECDITKKAKEILKDYYGCIEEVGVWLDNYKRRYTIDLYSPRHKLGIELYWQHKENCKKLIKRLRNYEKYFGDVICALLRDSNWKKKNRTYFYISKKLKKAGIKVIIVDISKTPPIYESP